MKEKNKKIIIKKEGLKKRTKKENLSVINQRKKKNSGVTNKITQWSQIKEAEEELKCHK